MAEYLVQVSYTPEAWEAMIREPQNRLEKVSPAVEDLGGKSNTRGSHSVSTTSSASSELPEAVDAVAFSIGVSAKGAVKAIKTTPLITMEQGIEAMGRAQRLSYVPPTKVPSGVR